MKKRGLIVSIDFELDWGYTNLKKPLSEEEISNGLNNLIKVLNKYNIKSTWAIVGQLFENNNEEEPDNSKKHLKWIIKNLKNNDLIEIGSHTYNHIFCEEVSTDMFKQDIGEMNRIASEHSITFKSIVFPRNQYNNSNVNTLKQANYTHFRSVLNKWFLKTNKYSNESFLKRLYIRFAELLPFKRDVIISDLNGLVSISDSRFFRFFSDSFLGNLITRYYISVLKYEMKRSFSRGNYYHIWFHPHNIMKKKNAIKTLDNFLNYYKRIERNNQTIESFTFTKIK